MNKLNLLQKGLMIISFIYKVPFMWPSIHKAVLKGSFFNITILKMQKLRLIKAK